MAAGGVRAVHLLTGRLLMSETLSAPVAGRTTRSFLGPPFGFCKGGKRSLGLASSDLSQPFAADAAVTRRVPQLDTIKRTRHDDPRIEFESRVLA